MISRPNLPTHASSKYSRSQQITRIGKGTALNQRSILELRPLAVSKHKTLRRELTWVAAVEADHFSRAHSKTDRVEVAEVMVASALEVEVESPTGLLPAAPESPQELMDRVMRASRALQLILPATLARR